MFLLRSIFGLAIAVGVFLLLAVLAWYIILPLFFIFGVIALITFVRAKFTQDKLKVLDIPTPLEEEKPKKKVIDVDYTEI